MVTTNDRLTMKRKDGCQKIQSDARLVSVHPEGPGNVPVFESVGIRKYILDF